MALRLIATACSALVMAACGDKLPESQTAKRLGEAPKQVVDRAAEDAAKAVQKSADRARGAE